MRDIGLYIHIPFCKSKCYYCDFNSYSNKENIQGKYIDSLIEEMSSLKASILDSYKISSIYIGGGTPTYLNLNALKKLLSFMKVYSGEHVEYTCEANPGTLTEEKLLLLKEGGVNRLSIGLQSWNDNILKRLGRIHDIRDFLDNYKNARDCGFKNINIDLMFAIQGQTIEDFSSTLDNVIFLKPEHISCYSLIIEEGTLFYKQMEEGKLTEVDEDMDRDMYHLAVEKLERAGYYRYEISNFAKIGYESRHNMIYWKTGEYLGVGAGAHSCINDVRFSNEPLPEIYIDKVFKQESPVCWSEELTEKARISEYMFMGLRMARGIDLLDFSKRFGRNLMDIYGHIIEELCRKGLLTTKENSLMLTDLGMDLSNQVFVEFIE